MGGLIGGLLGAVVGQAVGELCSNDEDGVEFGVLATSAGRGS